MAGIVNFRPTPVIRPSLAPGKPLNRVSFKISAEIKETSQNLGVSSTSSPTIKPPPNFKPPKPTRFAIRPDRILDVLTASLGLIFRLGTGIFVSGYSASFVSRNEIPPGDYAFEIGGVTVKETSKLGPRPEKPIEIYEFEGCPFCKKGLSFTAPPYLTEKIACCTRHWMLSYRADLDNYGEPDSSHMVVGPIFTAPPYLTEKIACCTRHWMLSCRADLAIMVREIVSVLDLDVLYYPCPMNGPNFRPKVAQMGGKKQFPYMVDPNTGVAMYESDSIIKYLAEKYGDGTVPLSLSLGLLTTLTEGFAMIGRMGKGSSYTPSKLPPKPLELWAYEPSPFCKVVREVLVELEIPHILHSCARGSPKRQILFKKAGHFQVPYLEDPNTGVEMFESAEIVDYLRATYVS
ncbi:hypothetical protein C5167_002829 [Papaver somniferum]|uniref:GST N-terminal domain-containing protein n=1 Tax=Papaver somniferum TaxID=3469 RepID=A0A4Y7L302_PAPSO|nr:hypothetical protein C5167_002829 [Papaver somniferum]